MAGLFELLGFLPLEYQRAAARWRPTSGQSKERHPLDHRHRRGWGHDHTSTPNTHLLRPVSGLQGIPRRFLITGTIFAMGRKGQLKPLSGLNRDGVLFRGPPGLGFDGSVNHVNFPGANHRLRGRPVGRKARGLLSFMHRRGFAVADPCRLAIRVLWMLTFEIRRCKVPSQAKHNSEEGQTP